MSYYLFSDTLIVHEMITPLVVAVTLLFYTAFFPQPHICICFCYTFIIISHFSSHSNKFTHIYYCIMPGLLHMHIAITESSFTVSTRSIHIDLEEFIN